MGHAHPLTSCFPLYEILKAVRAGISQMYFYHRSLLLAHYNPANCASYCPEVVPFAQVLSLQTLFFVLFKIYVAGVCHGKPLGVQPDGVGKCVLLMESSSGYP